MDVNIDISKLWIKKFDDVFYDNIYTFFMKRDLSKFNPRVIPRTEAKDDIINITEKFNKPNITLEEAI